MRELVRDADVFVVMRELEDQRPLVVDQAHRQRFSEAFERPLPAFVTASAVFRSIPSWRARRRHSLVIQTVAPMIEFVSTLMAWPLPIEPT